MEIIIKQSLGISKKGKRENNEDALFPDPENKNQQSSLFLVCDGVGGAARGEVASRIACNQIAQYFENNNIVASDKETVVRAVEQTDKAIDAYLAENPSAHGMATTLALLHLNKNGATVAWCGDSRVYQIRGNDIVFITIDHSYVNDLLKAGVITPDEAKDHPEKDVIMRAIQGASVKKAKVDAVVLGDVKKDDLFFLCTDGVLEALDEKELLSILSDESELSDKLQKIDRACQEKSKDNYTCYLVKIAGVKGKPEKKESIPTAKIVAGKKKPAKKSKTKKIVHNNNKFAAKSLKKRNRIYLSIITFSILTSLSLFFLLPKEKTTQTKTTSGQATTRDENEQITGKADNANSKAVKATEVQSVKQEARDSEKLPETTFSEQEKEPAAIDFVDESIPVTVDKKFLDPRDGNTYRITQIGDYHWFAQNLEFTAEGSKEPHPGRGGRYYTWQQAREVCPTGWGLPYVSLLDDLRPYSEDLRLNPQFTGHYRENENNVSRQDEAMFWFDDKNPFEQPSFFSLKQYENRPNRMNGDAASFKPVRCVKLLNSLPEDTNRMPEKTP